jgi:outer membrane immunogenic protein
MILYKSSNLFSFKRSMILLGTMLLTCVALTGTTQAEEVVNSSGKTDEMLVLATVPADWAGFYGGISYGKASGEITYFKDNEHNNGPYKLQDSYMPGFFAGYNFQNGNFVYGGELSTMFNNIGDSEDADYSDVTDLKARAGYTFGNALLYGTMGVSFSKFSEAYSGLSDHDGEEMRGLGYGIGVDYLIAGSYLIGLEFYNRDLNGAIPYASGDWSVEDSGFETLTVRLGMQF